MNKKITLQVINNEPTPIIKYVQCSTELPIEFYVVDYKIPDSSEVRFYLMKPSGKEIYMPCQIKDNIITLNPTRQTFAEYGKQEGQLQVIQRDKQLLSFKLRFDIEENKIENGKIKSKDEFSILDELINEARVLLPETEKAKDNANTSADKANTAADKANKSASDANTAASKANQSAKLAEDKAKEIQRKADNGDFDGATFTPSVSPTGVISWTNDKGEKNPASVNIKGPKGDKGDPGSIENISEQPIDNVIWKSNGVLNIPVVIEKFINTEEKVGAIAVILPVGFVNTFLKFDIEIQDGYDGAVATYTIHSQLYKHTNNPEGGGWTSDSTVFSVGDIEKEKSNLKVRLAYAEGKCVVLIGENNTDWEFSNVIVRNLTASFNKAELNVWRKGWDIKFDAKIEDYIVQRTIINPNILSKFEITEEVQDKFKAIGWTPQTGGSEIASLFQFLLDRIYPIGSYYISDNPTNPKELFGGSWAELSGVYLFARSSAHPAGEVFGSSTKKLVAGNIPPHTHPFSATTNTVSLKGDIKELASQSEAIDINASGKCSAYQSGTSGGYGTSIEATRNDAVEIDMSHNHSVSGTTGVSGSGTAFDILPPSKSVYVWKRIA